MSTYCIREFCFAEWLWVGCLARKQMLSLRFSFSAHPMRALPGALLPALMVAACSCLEPSQRMLHGLDPTKHKPMHEPMHGGPVCTLCVCVAMSFCHVWSCVCCCVMTTHWRRLGHSTPTLLISDHSRVCHAEHTGIIHAACINTQANAALMGVVLCRKKRCLDLSACAADARWSGPCALKARRASVAHVSVAPELLIACLSTYA